MGLPIGSVAGLAERDQEYLAVLVVLEDGLAPVPAIQDVVNAHGYCIRSLRGAPEGCHRGPKVSIVRTDTCPRQT